MMGRALFQYVLLLMSVFVIGGCAATNNNEEEAEEHRNNDVSTEQVAPDNDFNEKTAFLKIVDTEVIATNLDVPWAIAKVDDTFFVTERAGTIAVIENGEVTREQVVTEAPVLHHAEGGLLGFVLHPEFQQNQLAYLYHTYESDERILNRVILAERTNGGWIERDVLLDDIPGANFHNGGRMIIGPDEHLYLGLGDASIPELSQDNSSIAGTIIRMTLEGAIPEDNPFSNSFIYSYGHRNPQGLVWDEAGNTLYSSEHGPRAHDEINRIEPGQNYGWPIIYGDETTTGMEPPLFHSGTDTWAPSGMTYVEGFLYVAGLRGNAVFGFDVAGEREQVVWQSPDRIRDIYFDGDALYIITNNKDGRGNPSGNDDRLIRLVYQN